MASKKDRSHSGQDSSAAKQPRQTKEPRPAKASKAAGSASKQAVPHASVPRMAALVSAFLMLISLGAYMLIAGIPGVFQPVLPVQFIVIPIMLMIGGMTAALVGYFGGAVESKPEVAGGMTVGSNVQPDYETLIWQAENEKKIVCDQLGFMLRDDDDLSSVTDAFIYDELVNRKFITSRDLYVDLIDGYEPPDAVLDCMEVLEQARKNELSELGASSRNVSVLGLAEDITSEMLMEEHNLRLHPMSRSMVQITDDAFGKVVYDADGNVAMDGHELSITKRGTLLPIGRSLSANEIDIHALVVTEDGWVVWRRGTNRHPLYPNLECTSASASLESRHLKLDMRFQAVINDCIRERIRQNYGLTDDVGVYCCTIGMARIIGRNGAPEFYVLCKVNMPKDELLAHYADNTCIPVPYKLYGERNKPINSYNDSELPYALWRHVDRRIGLDDASISASAMVVMVYEAMIPNTVSFQYVLVETDWGGVQQELEREELEEASENADYNGTIGRSRGRKAKGQKQSESYHPKQSWE